MSGTSVTLVCSNYSGTPPCQFQWQVSNQTGTFVPIAGANSNSLFLSNVSSNNSGFYQLTFTAGGQSVAISLAELTIVYPPIISAQPAAGGLVLNWSKGVLLEATNLVGPWVTDNAAAPYAIQPVRPQTFYRVLGQ